MKLNFDSWFVKTFLNVSEYSAPNTICQLGRRIVSQGFLWLVVATIVTFVAVSYLAAAGGLLYVLFTDATYASIFPFNEKALDFLSVSVVVFFCLNTLLLGAAVISGIQSLREYLSNRKYQKRWELRRAAEEAGTEYVAPETPIKDFVVGIWKRIHDKTCGIIQYENHPGEAREAERQRRREEWDAELAAAIEDAKAAEAAKAEAAENPVEDTDDSTNDANKP